VEHYKDIYELYLNINRFEGRNNWIYVGIEDRKKEPKNTSVIIIDEDWLIDLQSDHPDRVVLN